MDINSSSPLAVETTFYETHKSDWLRTNRGQFVVLKGNDVLGFFPDFHDAYYAGVEKYGSETDFLVKRVVSHEPVFVVF